MCMTKLTGALIAAGGLLMVASAYAEPVLFGQLRADYGFIDDGDDLRYRFNEYGSRLGFKGASFLNQQHELTYILEAESAIADEDEVFNEVRQAWAGVRSVGDGEFRVGRHLSPARVSVAPVDMFVNQGADQRKILETDQLFDKSVVYLNRIDEFAYAVALSTDSANTHTATDFLINYNNENTYIAAAYLKGYDQQRISRLAATYLFPAGHKLGFAFEHLDDKGGDDHKAYVVSAGYRLDEQKLLKLQYGLNRAAAGGEAETLIGIGLDFDVSANAALQLQYSTNRHIDHADQRETSATIGMIYDF